MVFFAADADTVMSTREYWVQAHTSFVVYRYIDWSITVPWLMIGFNCIFSAVC